MFLRSILLILLASLAFPATAADWHRAESEHFVIHAKLGESELHELAVLAEDFDRVLRRILPRETSRGRKLELFLEENERRISSISDFRNIGWVGNWPELAGSFVVYDPSEDYRIRNHSLFYAIAGHHVDNAFTRPVPPWVKTGVQLFFATTFVSEEGVSEKGDFILGAPDPLRPMEGSMDRAKLELLLEAQSPPRTENAWKRFYGWSREAVFPLLTEPANSGLLEAYLDAYADGATMEDAATKLGDLDAWAKQVRERQTTRRPTFRRVVLEPEEPSPIAIRPMREDEIELTVPRFERLRREDYEDAIPKLRRLTERLPDSALVWAEFAAAEFRRVREADFGGGQVFRGFGFSNGEIVVTANPYSDAEAWRAVNRALELDPDLPQAIELRAEILMSRLVRLGVIDDVEGLGEGFEDIRTALAPLAAQPGRRPLAAALYHQTYIEEGNEPTPAAIDQLGRAFGSNPGVEEFRYAYAVTLAREGNRDGAERLLTSMLNHPTFAEPAKRALEQAP